MKAEKTAVQAKLAVASWFFLAGVVLLAVSWAVGRSPLDARRGLVEPEQISAGFLFLVYGAVPWWLQWAGILALLLGAYRWVPDLGWRGVLKGASVPLIVGAIWWGWLTSSYWNSNPLDVAINMLILDASRQMGGGPLGATLMFDVFGPLTAPLMLSGPMSMAGWPYLGAGLSTGAVAVVWITIARITDRLRQRGLSGREWLACGLLMLLWLLPVIIVSVSRVLSAH